HPNPVGSGLANDAILEAAGPDCIVPGQITPIKLLGVKVWPINIDLKFMEPVGRELQSIGKSNLLTSYYKRLESLKLLGQCLREEAEGVGLFDNPSKPSKT
ncbi:hypothetical protein U1Q18_008302, partial [Sarracenia purpurea var. burkii]